MTTGLSSFSGPTVPMISPMLMVSIIEPVEYLDLVHELFFGFFLVSEADASLAMSADISA